MPPGILASRGSIDAHDSYPEGKCVLVDGRAELYGEQFVLDYFDAVTAKDVNILLATLDKYQIDATLLGPDLPATKVLDHIAGWKRVYADDVAVIHVRDDQRKAAPSAAPGSSN